MSKITIRRVALGTHFTQQQLRDALSASPLCIVCKCEKATQVDHPHALMWGGKSDLPLALCGKCHNEKSTTETRLDVSGTNGEIVRHIQKWIKVARTATGKFRSVSKETVKKNSGFAKRIHRAKTNARNARKAGNEDLEKHYHKLCAQIRREARGA